MTPARAERLVRELTNVQSKVFHAVPVREAWPDHVIMQELRRQGSNLAMDIIRGCLETLRRQNLIREDNPRQFQQINHHERANGSPKEETDMASPENTTTTHRPAAAPAPASKAAEPARKLSTLDRLARISLKFRELADELDDIAIQADEDMKAQGQDSETLRQLQKLLGNIGARV